MESNDPSIDQRLAAARTELLDLSARNRLLNTPRTTTRSTRLEIVNELSQEVFRSLVIDGKAMTFLAAAEPASGVVHPGDLQPGEIGDIADDANGLAQPDEEPEDSLEGETATRHVDRKLQTPARL